MKRKLIAIGTICFIALSVTVIIIIKIAAGSPILKPAFALAVATALITFSGLISNISDTIETFRKVLGWAGGNHKDTARLSKGDESESRSSLRSAVMETWVESTTRPSVMNVGWLPTRLQRCDPSGQKTLHTLTDPSLYNYLKTVQHLTILGAQGVGKSVAMSRLAEEIIENDENRVPVVLSLSSYAGGSLADWLGTEIKRVYQQREKVAIYWAKNDKFVPLLDGLDDVPTKHRRSCVKAINEYLHEYPLTWLVVACRTNVYSGSLVSHDLQLSTDRHIEIAPLTEEECATLLRSEQFREQQKGLQSAALANPVLRQLLTKPLYLSIFTYTYAGYPQDDIPIPVSDDDDQRGLRVVFDQYANKRLSDSTQDVRQRSKKDPYSNSEVRRFLGWLARAMSTGEDRNETIFVPDRMQPRLLRNRFKRWLAGSGLAIGAGIAAFVIFGILNGYMFAAINTEKSSGHSDAKAGLTAGLFSAIAVGILTLVLCRDREVTPIESPAWRSSLQEGRILFRVAGWTGLGGVIGLPLGFWFGSMQSTNPKLSSSLYVGVLGITFGGVIGGVLVGSLCGLAIGLVLGLRPQPVVESIGPGEGMRKSFHVACAAAAVAASGGTILYGLQFGLPLSLVVGLRVGGADYIRHRVLRRLLVSENTIPKSFLDFLHYAHQRSLLNEVGGGYQFTHPSFRKFFAASHPEQ